MKSYGRMLVLLSGLGLFYSVGALGQDSTKTTMKTIFGSKNAKHKINYLGIYVAPELQYGQLNNSFAPMGGVSFMLQVNKKWGIGMTGFGGGGDRNDTTKNGGNFGGLKLEYTPKPDAAVHVTFPLMLGMGQEGNGFRGFGDGNGRGNHDDFGMGRFDKNNDEFRHGGSERNAYAVIQPGIALETNLFRYAKAFVGANYRFAFNSTGYSSALQGVSANVGVKLGVFDYSLAKKAKKQKMEKQGRMWRRN